MHILSGGVPSSAKKRLLRGAGCACSVVCGAGGSEERPAPLPPPPLRPRPRCPALSPSMSGVRSVVAPSAVCLAIVGSEVWLSKPQLAVRLRPGGVELRKHDLYPEGDVIMRMCATGPLASEGLASSCPEDLRLLPGVRTCAPNPNINSRV